MEHRLALTDDAVRSAWEASRRRGGGVVRRALGFSRLDDTLSWLVRPGAPGRGDALAVLAGGNDPVEALSRAVGSEPSGAGPAAFVGVGEGPAAGTFAILAARDGAFAEFASLRIAGPGMALLERNSPEVLRGDAAERWSRGAGGVGEAAWRRLVALRVLVVGAGRSGEIVATLLRRAGVSRLRLMDPDRIELHNLPQSGYLEGELGDRKSEALATQLNRLPGALRDDDRVRSVAERIESPFAVPSVKWADVVLCCVDNPRARLAAAWLAALYLKPLVDVGTGVLEEAGARVVGADVRLTLPGRCLWCHGGVAGLELVRNWRVPDSSRFSGEHWRETRAGSLDSLNFTACGLGVRALEELVAGRLDHPAWWRLDTAPDGTPSITSPQPRNAFAECPICRQTGAGDAALDGFEETLRQVLISRMPKLL